MISPKQVHNIETILKTPSWQLKEEIVNRYYLKETELLFALTGKQFVYGSSGRIIDESNRGPHLRFTFSSQDERSVVKDVLTFFEIEHCARLRNSETKSRSPMFYLTVKQDQFLKLNLLFSSVENLSYFKRKNNGEYDFKAIAERLADYVQMSPWLDELNKPGKRFLVGYDSETERQLKRRKTSSPPIQESQITKEEIDPSNALRY